MTEATAHAQITHTILSTGADGRARFDERVCVLDGGTPASRLSALAASGGWQWRSSPTGFESGFHCTTTPQWLVVLQGRMEIGLPDGTTRVFGPGQAFYSNDTLPPGATFDPAVHGHRSRLLGEGPLVTLFVRADPPDALG